MEEEEPPPPSLKLLMLQGPRKGETLEFQPGSAIRIGRVVRGNTLPIKDPGISAKHLSILTESGKWVLRHLDSSNGTVLDDTNIPPNTPFFLRDGSTIIIGEFTSILVSFLQPQQNPTRTESWYVDRPAPKRVTRNSKNTLSAIAVSDLTDANLDAPEEKVEEPKKNTRVTRNSKNKQGVIEFCDSSIGNSDAPKEKVEEEPKKNTRVTRNSKNKQSVIEICDSKIANSDAPKEKVEEEPTKNTRVTRNSKNKHSVIEISDSKIANSDAPKEKVEEEPTKKNTRVTRNSKNKGSVIGENSSLELGGVVENVEKKKTRGGAKGRRKLQEECADLNGDDGKETGDEREKKENLNGDDGNWPDLEKMSLGEWFDFLEVYLPKQIIDATEEMFDSTRQKAERLREYIIMMQENK